MFGTLDIIGHLLNQSVRKTKGNFKIVEEFTKFTKFL